MALSLGLPPVGVTHRRALRSPDFPPSANGEQRPPACPYTWYSTRTRKVFHKKKRGWPEGLGNTNIYRVDSRVITAESGMKKGGEIEEIFLTIGGGDYDTIK